GSSDLAGRATRSDMVARILDHGLQFRRVDLVGRGGTRAAGSVVEQRLPQRRDMAEDRAAGGLALRHGTVVVGAGLDLMAVIDIGEPRELALGDRAEAFQQMAELGIDDVAHAAISLSWAGAM